MDQIFRKVESSADRFQEAHFWIHTLERYYHDANPFRWHLNAFLKTLKEIPQVLQMELQNESGFASWFRNQLAALRTDPLIEELSKRRDIVVHKGMLVPRSRAFIGLTEGRGMKWGVAFPIHPLENSDDAMQRYICNVKKSGDFLELLRPDDESLPCIEREWRLDGFDEEIVDLCARAWLRVGETIGASIKWLGAEFPLLSLDCRHSSQFVQIKVYSREKLVELLDSLPSDPPDQIQT